MNTKLLLEFKQPLPSFCCTIMMQNEYAYHIGILSILCIARVDNPKRASLKLQWSDRSAYVSSSTLLQEGSGVE